MSDQLITIIGNLTKEPELRFTTGGHAVCSMSLATNKRYMKDGEWHDSDPCFWNLSVWNKLAENCAASLAKGQRVIVTGELEQRSYENKEGNKRTAFDFKVADIGPSLKWATAEVAKVTREHSSSSAASSQPTENRPPDPVYGDEEPF